MASPAENLAASLERLLAVHVAGRTAIRANQLSRRHRERLESAGFLKCVMKGWYVAVRPGSPDSDQDDWYATFWSFAADYLEQRFGSNWCLSADQSLLLHTGNWTVPTCLHVRSPMGGNKPTSMLSDTSVFDARLALPPTARREILNGLRVMTLPAALIAASPGLFADKPIECRAALAMLLRSDDLVRELLTGGHSKVAGRLVAAFRNIGRGRISDDIVVAMRSAGYVVQPADPFNGHSSVAFPPEATSPHVARLRQAWAVMRETVLSAFPAPPGPPTNLRGFLAQIDEIYPRDAYHSLCIEGIHASAAMIEQTRAEGWKVAADNGDAPNPIALASRGYLRAFQAARRSIEAVVNGEPSALVAERDHQNWHSELFGPFAETHTNQPSGRSSYRTRSVFIRASRHIPPPPDAIHDLMTEMFRLLRSEPAPAVRAVLGHFAFSWIHPHGDGNGRIGRLLMNVMFASGGWPWVVIPIESRTAYMTALEEASVRLNISPFARVVADILSNITQVAGPHATAAREPTPFG